MVDEGPGGGLAGRTVVDDHTCGHGGWLSATVTHTHTRGDGCGLVVARVLTPESTGVVVVVGHSVVSTWPLGWRGCHHVLHKA